MMEQGSTAFWRGAYEEHGPSVLAFLRSRLGSREDAEELLQETFVRAMRTDSPLREKEKVRGYLFTTAHNLLRNRARRAQVSPIVSAVPLCDPEETEATDARARLRALCERLDTVLEGMSADHRRAFELGVIDKTPYREIAQQTGWSLSQVKVNVYRSRKRAVQELADFLDVTESRISQLRSESLLMLKEGIEAQYLGDAPQPTEVSGRVARRKTWKIR